MKKVADENATVIELMMAEAMLCRRKNGWRNLPEIRYTALTNQRVIIIIEEGVEVYRSTIMNGLEYLKK